MSLHLKYRPTRFSEVVGQASVVSSLEKVVAARSHHAFLFTGPSGCGKTTLARIVMSELGCDRLNLREVDAATYTGIDAMREVTSTLSYAPMGRASSRGVIVDEAHSLSKAAWQSLLKIVEEPPDHAFWAFCTTEPSKVPATIRTRCASYALSEVDLDDIFDLVSRVASAEGLATPEDVLDEVATAAQGSPRQALSYLAQVASSKTRKEAAAIMKTAGESSSDVIDLCRALAKGDRDWGRLMKLVEPLKDVSAEGVRNQVAAYFTKAVMGPKGDRYLPILDAFGDPYPSVVGVYPLVLSVGRAVFHE